MAGFSPRSKLKSTRRRARSKRNSRAAMAFLALGMSVAGPQALGIAAAAPSDDAGAADSISSKSASSKSAPANRGPVDRPPGSAPIAASPSAPGSSPQTAQPGPDSGGAQPGERATISAADAPPSAAAPVTPLPRLVAGLLAPLHAVAGAGARRSVSAQNTSRANPYQTAVIVRPVSGPVVGYDSAENVQVGSTVSGGFAVNATGGAWTLNARPDWTPPASGARRANSGVTTSQRGAPPAPVAPARGTVSFNADGTFDYTPNAELAAAGGQDSFVVTVSDRFGRTVLVPVTVVVRKPAIPAVNRPDPSTGSVTGVVTGGSGSGDQSFAERDEPQRGSLVVDPDSGEFSYTPDAEARHAAAADDAEDADLSDTFTVAISDPSGGGTVVVPITVPIAPVNGAPEVSVRVGDPNATTGVVPGTVSGTDPDGDTLTYSAPRSTPRGTVTIDPSTGVFTYTPTDAARHAAAADGAGDSERTETFTVSVNDGHGAITELAVTVTISPVNTAPTATATVSSPDRTGVVTGTITGTDPDGDTLRYSAPASTPRGTVSVDSRTGAFTYTPGAAARASGTQLTDTVTLIADDGHGGTATVTVTVVIDPNRTPTAAVAVGNPDLTSGLVSGTVTGSDADGDVVSYSAAPSTPRGTVSINPSTGAFTYTPSAPARHAAAADSATLAERTDTFTVAVDDGRGGIATVAVTVAIAPSNAAPTLAPTVATPDSSTGTVGGSAGGSDADGDTLSYSLSAGPASGTVTIDPVTGAFVYTPSAAARHAEAAETVGGLFSGRYGQNQVVDVARSPGCSQQGGTCTVSLFQDAYVAPFTNRVRVTWATGDYVQFVDTGAVVDGRPNVQLVQYASTGTQKSVISANGYVQSLGDGILYIGEPSISGGTGYFISNTLGIDRSAQSSYTYTVDAFNPGARELASYDASATPLAPGQQSGVDSFTIAVADGHGGTATRRITVPISPVNTAPTATFSTGAANASTGAVTGAVVGSDADGDALTYTGPATTARGSVIVNRDGTFTYTPNAAVRHAAAAAGALAADRVDTFTVTVTDGYGGRATQVVSVPIAPSNVAPTLAPTASAPDAATGRVNGSAVGADADADALTYAIVSGPANGTASIDPATGAFVYTPSAAARHAAAAERPVTTGLQTITLSDPAAVSQGTFSLNTSTLNHVSQLASSGTNRYNYIATFFTATSSRTYVFGQTSAPVDTVMIVYTGTFDPASPGGGAVALNDDTPVASHAAVGATVQGPSGCGSTSYCPQVSADLTAGQVVTLVVTTYSAGAPLGLPQSFYANGPGGFSQSSPEDGFTISVDDGHGGITTRRVSVPITPGNSAPVATATPNAPDVAGLVTGTVAGSDADGDTLTYSAPTSSTFGRGAVSINAATGAFTFTPTAAARHAAALVGGLPGLSADTFTITVRDGYGGVTLVPVVVSIGTANNAPSAFATPGAPNVGTGVVTGTTTASDPDNDPLTYSGSTTTSKGTVVVNASTGAFTYTPTAGARHAAAANNAAATGALSDTFTLVVSDGYGGAAAVPVTVAISPTNNVPTGTFTTATTFANGNFATGLTGWTAINSRVRLGGADTVAGWPTPVDPTTAPDGGTEASSLTTQSYTTTVTNGRAVMTSNVNGVVNTPPGSGGVVHGPVVVSNDAVYIRSGATVQFDWEASGGNDAYDVFAYILNVTTGATAIMLNATGANASASQPVTVVNFPVATAGSYKFVFTSGTWDATRGLLAGARLSIDNVQILNNGVVGAITGAVVASDADGDALSFALTASPTNGTVTVDPVTGGFDYIPNNPVTPAADSFGVSVSDGHGGSLVVTVTVP